jgi:hypothetical protein
MRRGSGQLPNLNSNHSLFLSFGLDNSQAV